ncbi:endonuclease III [Candidatus Woesearchaeota archaeon]|nr:endonuclease III [Candidatus Woesearchaeota archaeon]
MKVDIDSVYKILKKEVQNYKVPVVDLVEAKTEDPFKVTLATILSARTKDEVTLKAVERLFLKVKKPSDLDKLSKKEIEKLIYPVCFYHNKAEHLKKFPLVLKKEFNNIIPSTIEELIKLPGVGRKTANLVIAVAFKKPAMCVDTHVHKIVNRLGYVKTKDPLETEFALRKILPKKYWITFNSILVAFGQNLCRPVSPFCSRCPVNRYCNKVGVTIHR